MLKEAPRNPACHKLKHSSEVRRPRALVCSSNMKRVLDAACCTHIEGVIEDHDFICMAPPKHSSIDGVRPSPVRRAGSVSSRKLHLSNVCHLSIPNIILVCKWRIASVGVHDGCTEEVVGKGRCMIGGRENGRIGITPQDRRRSYARSWLGGVAPVDTLPCHLHIT